MPLYIDIRINQKPLDSLVIGRLEDFKGHDRAHRYRVTSSAGGSALFDHVYSDGARVCVQRALNALDTEGRGIG